MSSSDEHYIVAIGASAGGLEAIHEFFDHMPEKRNFSFIVIQHLSPDHKSLLVELVSRHTNMNVFEASHNLDIRKSCIYVIPNNKFITISRKRLILSEKLPLKMPNNAIDIFMHSLASDQRQFAVGVILSGTGSDGTKGIAAIKEEGGLVLAQDPATAKFDGMPNSAISSGNVDYILAPGEMPQQILNYISEPDFIDDRTIDDAILEKIFEQIRKQAGFDFHFYKTPTITRRVFHRMMKKSFSSVEDYYKFLKAHPEECKELGKEFLINVTRFFRDKEAFDVIKKQYLPDILKGKAPGDTIKIWVCACSTGEEVYSLAILLDEVLEQNPMNLQVKFFATDIDKGNIDIASKGLYPRSIEADVDQERLMKYFTKNSGGYQISSRIRRQIVFATHNVIKDPPFIKNDLVSCRNMLIYMNPALQQRVYSVLLFALNRGGYLFFGTTENANYIRDSLEEVNGRWKIYKKIGEARITPYFPDVAEKQKRTNVQLVRTQKQRWEKHTLTLWEDLKDTLFGQFNFAAFYIDQNFEIRDAVGHFDPILKLPKKVLRLNLLRMLPAHISTVLISEIKKAWSGGEQRVISNLHFQNDGKNVALQVVVRPALPAAGYPHTMVAFHFMELAEQTVPHTTRPSDIDQNDYVLTLEEELNETKENLQQAIEDLETANEELQSSNEELLSANEELQSSNEELQSLNEELHTLNTEHQLKIKELIELNDDLNNYFRSSNIGQVFLDRRMMIRKFNPASASMINFIDSDIGRPITHISTNISYTGLIQDIELVLKKNENIEKEVQLNNGLNILLRIMPYITQDQRTSGAIISFIDITTVTNLNNIIRGVFNSSLSSIVALKVIRDGKTIRDLEISATNQAATRMLQSEPGNLAGSTLKKDLNHPVFNMLFNRFVDVIEKDVPLHTDVFIESTRTWLEVTAVKMMDGLMATFSDITAKKSAEERLKRNYVELVAAKENLKKLNAELEQKVAERTQLLSSSEERFRLVSRATNDAIWDWDLVNNQLWVSDAFYSLFNYDPASPFSRKDLIEKIHPEDRNDVERSIHKAINDGKKNWSREYRFVKADGSIAEVLDRGYVLQNEFNMPYRILGSILDITGLKQAEREIANSVAQRKFLAESMPLIVLTARPTGEIEFVNHQFEVYTGMDPEEALDHGWLKAVHPEDEWFKTRWQESISTRSDFQVEIRLRMFMGEYHWNLVRAKGRKNENGEVVGWAITTIDIHDQRVQHETLERKVEERTLELMRINHALEISNNDLQQFASIASHDLQEPLRKINLYANLIHDRFGEQLNGATPYLGKILQSSIRMKSIINNIMGYSKLSAENASFEKTDINRMIEEILEDLEISINEKGAEFDVGRFPEIEAISGQIRQVFQNVIGNALKFSRKDVPPKVEITAERIDERSFEAQEDPDGNFVRISIRDNGIGFNNRFNENIFKLFHRLHSKDSYEGTGIGLAIAKKIVEKHGGLITAEGVENEGSVFTIVLPIEQTEHVHQNEESSIS
jgi:two-component system CheB/CheR fusion protein